MNLSFRLTTYLRRVSLLSAICLVVLPTSLRAQMGNDNPTGVSGMFNGNVNTAGSYDPYTGNATRSITDISVAGAVGAYPLAFTRTMNSRYTPGAGTLEFGAAGSWRHSYQWTIDPITIADSGPNRWYVMPGTYNVNYPDGRRISFYSQSGTGDSYFRGLPGVSDRFQQLHSDGDSDVYVLLPDGGKIWFTASISRDGDDFGPVISTFEFQFAGIIDPYGQVTTVTYPGDGSMQITEPAGRWLKLFYITTPWMGDTVLSTVQASDGRSVVYNYGGWQPAGAAMYSYLGNVQYRDNNGGSYAQAIYAYQPGNTDPNGRPLIAWAIDPMYGGPMWAISYNFVPGSSGGVYGQLQSENYLDPFTGTPGQVVSSLSANGNSRTETRGDGPSRTFNYAGGKLGSYTDFKGQPSYISYDGNGFTNGFTDARGNTTTTSREGIIGATSVLTHPDQSTQGYAYSYRDGGPYYVQIRGDELGRNTYFSRDANYRVTKISYGYDPNDPNAFPTEEFTYNAFGQILTHKLTTGGTESFAYDARGLRTTSTDPLGNATHYYYYQSGPNMDQLQVVTDPRGNSTAYEYNPRGQLAHIQHQDYTYIQAGYNVDGTLAWFYDELGHMTTFTYDNYKRVVSVTNPLNQTTTYNYALDWSNPYLHASNTLKYVLSPMQKNVVFDYDENLRRRAQTAAAGTSDIATTWFEYDAVGNLTKSTDPRGNITTFGYDNRNRETSITNALNQTVTFEFDTFSNKTKEIRPDGAFRSWDYELVNPMNRLVHAIDWRTSTTEPAVTTTYDHNVTSTVETITDAKGDVYIFGFDLMHRKTSETYPPDVNNISRSESWTYDSVGNLDHYTNRAGATQQFAPYDNRNRPTSYTWSDGTQGVTFEYDVASRLTALHNAEADITFGYDAANHKISETETIKSYGLNQTHTVPYEYDADGHRSRFVYPQGWDYRLSYTNRGQLDKIALAGYGTPTVQYTYDVAGNRSRRTTFYGAYTDYAYNAINRLYSQSSYFANGYVARYDYGFDAANRISYELRNSAVADGFSYDAQNEVTGYHHDGTVNNGTVTGGYEIGITYDANGNRIAATEACCVAPYAAAQNNQYVSDWTGTLSYDGNANLTWRAGWAFGYDAQNRLLSIDSGSTHIRYHYDPLNRIVARDTNEDITTHVWDSWNLIEERTANNDFKRMYFHGAAPNEIVGSYGPAYGDVFYFQDGRGNVTHATGPGNNVLEHYTYFPMFGQPTIDDGYGNLRSGSSLDNRFLFKGALFVPGPDIYDMRNRFFLPNLGRFMQSDPLGFGGGDTNLFRYCGNDPVNGSDPTGLLEKERPGGKPPVPIKPYEPKTSNSLGVSHDPNAPISTQGWWSSPSGLPTGTFGYLADSLARAAGFEGYDADTGAPVYRAQPADSTVGQGAGIIGDILGKIWALPNTVIGLVIGIASLPFGGEIHLGNNAIQFTNVPFGPGGALTLGNVQLYNGLSPSDVNPRYNGAPGSVDVGLHEQAHTYQNQALGPLFLPIYLLNGGISPKNPLENAADDYSQGVGSWFPGGW